MSTPKVLGRRLDVKVNDLNKTFLLSQEHVARRYEHRVRNIRKQKSSAASPESQSKLIPARLNCKGSLHGYGNAEHPCR
ncbi:hypothetical protein [Bradyrhizobium canariense]|uniref:hypothetical protein n=1 Tax=Bradyrhizobium canariense TaxID=255045 RepID=UPI0011BA6C91|nr:hypothetical protein [Bradyrhizobium canariense]